MRMILNKLCNINFKEKINKNLDNLIQRVLDWVGNFFIYVIDLVELGNIDELLLV